MRNRFFPVALRAAAIVLFLATGADASEIWGSQPFSSDPAKLFEAAGKIKGSDPKEPVVILLDETYVTFAADGTSKRVERLIFRVVEQSAVGPWGVVETQWSPWYQERPVVDARVITEEGTVHRLDPKSFGVSDAEDDPDMFSDVRVLSGPLPAIAVGSLVEQTITFQEKKTTLDAGSAGRHRFGRWMETQKARLVIEHPTGLTVHLVNRTTPRIEAIRTENSGTTRLELDAGRFPPFRQIEWNVPGDTPATSWVAWSTGRSWQDVARRYAQIVDEQIGDRTKISALTKTVVGGAKSDREKAERIVAMIAGDIRYAGVEFAEGSIRPRSPAETLRNKYGDCKDKATLLIAMLREAGVRADPVLIRSGRGYDVHPDLPGLGEFDHVIVIAGTEPDRFWIDPTDQYARVGELPDSDQDRMVLIANADTTELVRTPADPSSANIVVEHRRFILSEKGAARVIEITEYTGSDERSFRRHYAEASRKQNDESFKSYAEGAYLAKEISSWKTTTPADLKQRFRIDLEIDKANRGNTGGGEAVVALFTGRITNEMPRAFHETDEERAERERGSRKHDFVFDKPFQFEVRYQIEPPPGYEARALPENERIPIGAGLLTKEYSRLPSGVVVAVHRLDSGPRRITATQFEEARKMVLAIAAERAVLLYFDQIGRKFIEAGEIGKAVTEFRRLSRLHPNEGLHYADAARALLAGGFGAAAREEARRGVKAEPKSPDAHAALGFVLSHDLLGRLMRRGHDRAGAIAAYRKAKELDPEEMYVRDQLAALQHYSETGVPYADMKGIDAAITEYIALKAEVKDVDKNAVDRELMILYGHRGRWDDLTKLLAETQDREWTPIYRVVAAGATKGGKAALEAADRVEVGARRSVQTQAGSILVTFRLYEPAADLVAAAALGAPNASELRIRAELLRNTKRSEELKIEPVDAASVVRLALRDLFGGADEKALDGKYSAKEAASIFYDQESGEGESAPRRMQAMKAIASGTTEARIGCDVMLSSAKMEVDGDDATGYRVRARMSGTGSKDQIDFSIYVIREEGQYRIAASNDSPSELALQALRLAERGKVDAARRWLDWARDHISSGSDDPLASHPFAGAWNRRADATPEDVIAAAAILLPHTRRSSDVAVPVLLKSREKTSDEIQWRIDLALVKAYGLQERWADALAYAERVATRFPDSGLGFEIVAAILEKLDRRHDLVARAEARLKIYREDASALRTLGMHSLRAGTFEDAVRYFGQSITLGSAQAGDFNNYAWSSVFVGNDLSSALETAQQAVSRSPSSPSILNTLAVVYAEKGQSSEARDTLLKSIELLESDEVDGSDWYVIGRIAENQGILDAATEAYRRVDKKKEEGRGTAWELAQRRLAAMVR